jgi:hypothetical protein
MRRALTLHARYPEMPLWYMNWVDHQTAVIWANFEFANGNCQGANMELDEATRLLNTLPQGMWLVPYRMQMDSFRVRLADCHQAGAPPSLGPSISPGISQ